MVFLRAAPRSTKPPPNLEIKWWSPIDMPSSSQSAALDPGALREVSLSPFQFWHVWSRNGRAGHVCQQMRTVWTYPAILLHACCILLTCNENIYTSLARNIMPILPLKWQAVLLLTSVGSSGPFEFKKSHRAFMEKTSQYWAINSGKFCYGCVSTLALLLLGRHVLWKCLSEQVTHNMQWLPPFPSKTWWLVATFPFNH